MFKQSLKLVERDMPIPSKDEALIRIRMAGICNTDLEILKGYMQFSGVPGHEFVGDVVECEDSSWIGKRVVGEINLGCGHCAQCNSGIARHCPTRQVLGILDKDGVFAEFITLPVKNLHIVPDILTDEEAVFIEPIAAACEILEQIKISDGSIVAIIGDGKLGQLIAGVIRLTGCDITVIGKHPNKLQRVAKLGINTCLRDNIPDRSYDVVIEASGSPSGIHQSMKILKPRGILIIKSTTQEDIQINLATVVINEIQIIGSRCGRFEPAIELLRNRSINVMPLITATFLLDDWKNAFVYAQESESMKILLQMANI